MALNLVARLSLRDDFSSRMRRVTGSLGEVERRTKSVTSGFKTLTTTMAGVAGALGVTALLSKGMNMVSSSIEGAFSRIDTMEAFERTMTVLTGSAEKTAAALEATRESVTGTAYGLDVAAKGVQNFVTRGVEIGRATKYVEAWGDAVAFYGEGSNEQLSTVMDALGKMTSSGKVGMDQMNRLYDVGIDGVGMYAKAVGKDVGKVQKALSKGKITSTEFIDVVTKAMMEGTNGVVKISGAAKEAGATWDAAFTNMKAAVTRGVTSIIQTIDEMLTDNGLPTMRDMIASVGKNFEKALNGAAAAIKPTIERLKTLYKAVKPVIPAIKSFAIAVGIAVAAVGGFFAVVGVFKLIGAGLMFLISPIGLIIGGITALVLGFQAAYKHSEPFRKAIDGIVGKVKGMASAFKTGGSGGILAALGFSPGMITKITDYVAGIKTKASEFVSFLKEKWAELQPSIKILVDRFISLKGTVVEIFKTLWAFLQPIFGALGDAFMIIADIVVIAWRNIIAPAINFAISVFQALWKIVGPILVLLGETIGLAFGILKIVWDTILKPVTKYLLGAFATAFDKARPYIDDLGEGFEVLGGIIETIAGWFGKFTGALKKFKVPNWLSRLGGGGTVKFESNEAESTKKGKPKYHGIDYVPYNGYQATLHKGEQVVPAQQVRESKQGGFGGGVTVTGNTFHVRQESDIDDIAEQLYRMWSAAAEGGA